MREAKYAGSFYPSKKEQLNEMLDSFLEKVPEKEVRKIKAVVVPHAGYVFSGQTAAFAYKLLSKQKPTRIILLGPSHKMPLQGAFTFSGSWNTPLGEKQITPAELPVLEDDFEHSLEVQLPFLQKTLEEFNFTPIIYGDINPETITEKISPSEEEVIIASSDLSHFFPYAEANEIDSNTINKILNLDEKGLREEGNGCGLIGIIALVILAKENNWKPVLLDYKNSGDITGEKEGVVGYASIIFMDG
jgi:MEMO1 family protein